MPSPEIVPVHHNIFINPPVEPFSGVPAAFARGQAEALEGMDGDANLDHRFYVRALMGAERLEQFYNMVSQAIMFHAEDRSKVAPMGFRSKDGEFILGRAHRSQPTLAMKPLSGGPPRYDLFTEIAGSFARSYDTNPTAYLLDANDRVQLFKPPRGYVQCHRLESAFWVEHGKVARVERDVYSTVIAVGREAVELMPELKNPALANAYDRLLNPLVAKK